MLFLCREITYSWRGLGLYQVYTGRRIENGEREREARRKNFQVLLTG